MPESIARRLEELWERGQRPDPAEFLAEGSYSYAELLDVILQDQRCRWNAGIGVRAEKYLERWPEVTTKQEDVLDLIYTEFVLREQIGESPKPADFERRFPALAGALRKQFAVHRALASTAKEPSGEALSTIGPATAAARKLPTAPRLSAYDLIAVQGQGGMGQVYKARQKALDRIVAVKVIRSANLENDQAVARFLREGRAVARLAHPNVVIVHDAGCEDGVCFLAMEYLEGSDLHQLVAKEGPLSPIRACALLREAALGLHHAHDRNLVHRDVKPANLFLAQPEGRVKVLDFGLASLRAAADATSDTPLTEAGQFVGTPDYAAPEMLTGAQALDRRVDIYSLGCTAYYLLSGEPPFPGGNLLGKLLKHRDSEPASLQSRGRSLPAGLDAVLRRMLAKDPANRFSTCAEVAAALEPFCVETAPKQSHVRAGRGRIFAGAAAAAMVGLVVCVAVVWNHVSQKQTDAPIPNKTGELGKPAPKKAGVAIPPGAVNPTSDDSASVLLTQPGGTVAHPEGVESVAFFPDGCQALTGGVDGIVRRWDVAAGRLLDEFPTKQGRLVAISTDGKKIVTGGLETIQVWDAPGRLHREFMGEQDRLSCLVLAPNARILATAELEMNGPKLVLWDLDLGKETFRFPNLVEPILATAFSPDGKRLLFGGGGMWKKDRWVGSDFDIRVWDISQRKELRRLIGHTDTVGTLAFAPGGKVALSGGRDRSLRLWNVETGKELARCDNTHEDGIRKAAFTPDGRFAVTSGTDGRVKLWSLPNAAGGKPYEGAIAEVADFAKDRHANIVTSLAVSPDGRFALSGSRDGTLRRWSLPAP